MATQDKNKQESNNTNNNEGGFSFYNIIYFGIAFFVIQFVVSFFRSNSGPTLHSILLNTTYYDLNIYLLNSKPSTYDFTSIKPIYTFSNMKYCYNNDTTLDDYNVYNISVSISHNISHLLKTKHKSKYELYLVSEMKLHDYSKYKKRFKKYLLPQRVFYTEFNVLKYVDDLSSFFSQDIGI